MGKDQRTKNCSLRNSRQNPVPSQIFYKEQQLVAVENEETHPSIFKVLPPVPHEVYISETHLKLCRTLLFMSKINVSICLPLSKIINQSFESINCSRSLRCMHVGVTRWASHFSHITDKYLLKTTPGEFHPYPKIAERDVQILIHWPVFLWL